MSNFNTGKKIRALLALWLAVGCWLQPALAAPKGSKALNEGRKAELRQEYDKALQLYDQAQKEDLENQVYVMATRRLRFVAGQTHVDQGHRLLDLILRHHHILEFRIEFFAQPFAYAGYA